MLLHNHTPFPAIAWPSLDQQGREQTSLMVRVTCALQAPDEQGVWSLRPAPEQGELYGEDVFYDDQDDPQTTSVAAESDYCPGKPHTDILLNAVAWAPGIQPVASWTCGLQMLRLYRDRHRHLRTVTLIDKSLQVYGPRHWQLNRALGYRRWQLTEPEPIRRLPIRYEYAYGGCIPNPDPAPDADPYLACHAGNPAGCGLIHPVQLDQTPQQIPAPQIVLAEEAGQLRQTITRRRLPVPLHVAGLGIIHRAWQPRREKAGTLDADWLASKAPLLPDDFDAAHQNAAPEDQQIPGYARPGDLILLHQLYRKRIALRIPEIAFIAGWRVQPTQAYQPALPDLDTVLLDLQAEDPADWSVSLSWRKQLPAATEARLDLRVGAALRASPTRVADA